MFLFLSAVLSEDRPPKWQLAGIASAVLLLVAWVIWIRLTRPSTAVVFSVISFASFIIADSMVSIGIQWITLVVLLISLGRVAAACYALVVVLTTMTAHIGIGSPIERILLETTAAVLVAAAGLALAELFQRNQRMLEELRENLRHSTELAYAHERERIAASLHDGLGHRLTTIGLGLDFSSRMIDRDPQRAREEVQRARHSTTEALDLMRATVRAMRPVAVDHANDAPELAQTLREFAATFDTTSLSVTVVDEQSQPETDPGCVAFKVRFVQEALTNVLRHSGADHAHIIVSDGSISVSDNGRGNDAEPSFGLRHLQQSAATHGYRLDIHPHGGLGGGSRLSLVISEAP
ncbi:Sensor histidine kinase DesK [Corynebacterium atrinae]|nr:Sensor histidine kinase DesK [Corynebacterium atrinae]